jgi:hypothetical protein
MEESLARRRVEHGFGEGKKSIAMAKLIPVEGSQEKSVASGVCE